MRNKELINKHLFTNCGNKLTNIDSNNSFSIDTLDFEIILSFALPIIIISLWLTTGGVQIFLAMLSCCFGYLFTSNSKNKKLVGLAKKLNIGLLILFAILFIINILISIV